MQSVETATPDEGGAPPSSSFTGRLNLSHFTYQDDTQPVRRSPRLSTPQSSHAPSASPAPSRTSTKRKAPPSPAPAPASSAASAPAASPAPRKKSRAVAAAAATGSSGARPSAGYTPPSKYAHLSPLPDRMGPDLLVLFVGLNPGLQTAATQHAYAHATNLFWPLLHSSGITPVRCRATEDATMPARFGLGLTNIVSRPSRNGAELSRAEMDAGVAALEDKARRWRPGAVCIVGKSIWESVWRVRHGRAIKKHEFAYGWQPDAENMGIVGPGDDAADVEAGVVADEGWRGARVFVATSTSGLAATVSKQEKEKIWRELGAWVEQRREERVEGGEQPVTS